MKDFNAKEILEIAIQNEKNGAEFYYKLSEQIKDNNVKNALHELVNQENEHITIIKGLINKLLEKDKELSYYDDPEELLYLQAIANASVFKDDYKADYLKDLLSDVIAALHYAVRAEIKSIEFYKELLEVMAPKSSKTVVKELIKQEKEHAKKVYKMIKEYKP